MYNDCRLITCVQVIFDPMRARPHYLILWKDEVKDEVYLDVMEITSADKVSLICCAKEVVKIMGLEELAILSLHQGHFAAHKVSSVHLLVKPDKYLEEFKRLGPDPIAYEEIAKKVDGWFNKSIQQNEKWKWNDLDNLRDYIARLNDKMKPAKFNHFQNTCDIIFHSTQPRIGFKLHDPHQDEVLLLRAMEQFVEEQHVSGSHLCVCLSKSLAVYDKEFGSAQIRAYLQVHIRDFYRINPNRHSWLEKFELPETDYEQYT